MQLRSCALVAMEHFQTVCMYDGSGAVLNLDLVENRTEFLYNAAGAPLTSEFFVLFDISKNSLYSYWPLISMG